ncbi:MAG: hypothetical protein JW834_03855 [Candidatus Diapherotrites archaeon]|nr:hypothetical protein [Candidatus Diapherotrites archaeon]
MARPVKGERRKVVKGSGKPLPSTIKYHLDAENPIAYVVDSKTFMKAIGTGKKMLEVGHGSNLAPSKAAHDLGAEVHGITMDLKHIAKRGITDRGMLKHMHSYVGDFMDATQEGSPVKGPFDHVLFWGSLHSTSFLSEYCLPVITEGRISALLEKGELNKAPAYFDTATGRIDPREFLKTVLRNCKTLLGGKGRITIVSPRYTGRTLSGSGEVLTNELEKFHQYIIRLKKLGAKKIHVYGLSREGAVDVYRRGIKETAKKHEGLLRKFMDASKWKIARRGQEEEAVTDMKKFLGKLGRGQYDAEHAKSLSEKLNYEYKLHMHILINEIERMEKKAKKLEGEQGTAARIDAIVAEF